MLLAIFEETCKLKSIEAHLYPLNLSLVLFKDVDDIEVLAPKMNLLPERMGVWSRLVTMRRPRSAGFC